ncbi:AraC-like DNA-binding protein [Paenibacillus sp. SORGH_AS306]|uniref:AraC family transcriptional regulator n=1 Tax=unclassified Paenibacillus TaxID=185978 RepID=UPI00278625FA|nr:MULTISPECIES: AraC family transcriptional regulator [unclassified Paenibacillus]MDQ1236243.1 AraC-like DNA-binding protein [Paenibacillus sp. SORGH_AS_0306]MDR6108597.1 AraC-like DNA-binding protein [Paenibacillus sp. SORGH_AS_0338]
MPNTLRLDQSVTYGYRSEMPFQPPTVDGFHSHLHYEIYYFHAGVCTYIIGDRSYDLRPGDVLLMHGMTLHRPHPAPDQPYIRSILHFDPAVLHNYIQPEHISELLYPFEHIGNCRLSLNPEQQAEWEQSLAYLQQIAPEPNEKVSLRFIMRMCDLLSLLAERCKQEHITYERIGKSGYAQAILDYIEAHYMNDITLDDIADHLHLSKPYIASVFKQSTGTTVFKYLYNRRITQATLLLQYQSDLSITEASRLVGFKQLTHFSRLFKQMVGCSPEVYRARWLQDAINEH